MNATFSGVAGLGDGGDQRAPVLGPVLRGRRRAPPHRLQPHPRHLQLRELPGVGLHRPDPGDGDLPLPGLQRALEDDPRGPGDAARHHVHRRDQPVAVHRVPGNRPVGRALRVHPGRPDRRGRSAPSRTRTASTRGGQVRTPICQLPNVEHTEQSFPVLFLYRKELPDSGGAGRFRGGMSAESCFIPHNTEEIVQDTLSSGERGAHLAGAHGRLSLDHQPLRLRHRERHRRAVRPGGDAGRHRRGWRGRRCSSSSASRT